MEMDILEKLLQEWDDAIDALKKAEDAFYSGSPSHKPMAVSWSRDNLKEKKNKFYQAAVMHVLSELRPNGTKWRER